MNKFLPPELKDLSDSKKRIMQNVMEKVDASQEKRKWKWPYAAMTAAVLACAMFFVFQVTMDNGEGIPGSDTETPQIEGEKPVDPLESPDDDDDDDDDEEKLEDEEEASIDLTKPTFTDVGGVFTVNGITVGDTQEDVIRQLGNSFEMIDDLDGSGADMGMNYNDQVWVLFYRDKVYSIMFLAMDEEHARKLYMDAEQLKFMSDTMRFIYSLETAHIIKMEYTPYGQLQVGFSLNHDPNLGGKPGFTLEQVGRNSYHIGLDQTQPIVSMAKEKLYLHGLTLGDTESKVIAYFGYDFIRNEKDDGETILLYGDEVEFTFVDGKLEIIRYLKVNENYFNQVLTDFEGVDLYSAETLQMINTEHSESGNLIVTLHYDEK